MNINERDFVGGEVVYERDFVEEQWQELTAELESYSQEQSDLAAEAKHLSYITFMSGEVVYKDGAAGVKPRLLPSQSWTTYRREDISQEAALFLMECASRATGRMLGAIMLEAHKQWTPILGGEISCVGNQWQTRTFLPAEQTQTMEG